MALTAAWARPGDAVWTAALARLRHDTYHTCEYVTTAAKSEDAEPIAFVVDDDERLFFLPLLLRAVPDTEPPTRDSVSPYGYPGPLLNDEAVKSDGFADECLALLRVELRAQNVCSAFVRMNPILNDRLADEIRDDALVPSGQTVSIDLTQSPESFWASMRKGHTNAVNKARRFGFEVTIAPAVGRFDEFVTVYAETLVRLQAASHYHFTTEHLRQLAAMPHSYIALATLGPDVAGAYLFFECNGIVQMHLGGPRAEFMRPSASNLLIHDVALWGMERGDEVLHLGGGLGAASDDSLFLFKSGFSPRRHRYDTMRIVADDETYKRLTDENARRRGDVSSDELMASGYFPAYRSS